MAFGLSAGAIGAIGAVGGALISSSAAGDAAGAQQASTEAGIAEQRRQFDLVRGDTASARGIGESAIAQLARELGLPQGQPGQPMPQEAIDPTKEPGYQFGLQQGQTALDRRIAAMGGRVSGAALKASTRYNQDYATTGYAAAYNRQNSARSERLNRLQALAGFGQTAAATSGQTGIYTSNAISKMATSQGDASGAAQIAQGNIWGDAFNQVAANYKPPTNPMSNMAANQSFGTATQNWW